MSSANPYAPPQSAVSDVAGASAFQPVHLWTSSGRIGRLRMLAYSSASIFILWIAGAIAGFTAAALHSRTPATIVVLLAFAYIPLLVFGVLTSIKRLHDIGWSGWGAVLMFIPLVGFVVGLILMIAPGTNGQNAYGGPPPPNTLGVRLLALAFPLIVVIGILAAIAIPAYQTYKARAAATAPH